MLVACNNKQKEPVNPEKEFGKVLELYCSDDPKVALQGLLSHREQVFKWQTVGVDLDYNHVLAILDARIFNLQVLLGDSAAPNFFRSSTNFFTQSRASIGLPPYEYPTNWILDLVKMADTNLNVRWKLK